MPAGDVNDRQSSHPERDLIIYERALIVRTAVGNHSTHAIDRFAGCAFVAMLITNNESGNSTHCLIGWTAQL